jgi:hypothetical protein
VHGDHLGDAIQPAANARECGKPDFSVSVTPNSNTVKPGAKTATFQKATKVPVHVPLSGKTMQFDGTGKCTTGC